MEDNSAIKQRLRDFMESTGMKQAELSRRLGVSPATISEILSGNRKVMKKRHSKIAEVIGVSQDDLLGEKDFSSPRPNHLPPRPRVRPSYLFGRETSSRRKPRRPRKFNNPFLWRKAIKDPNWFFFRDGELDHLDEQFSHAGHGNVQIFGPRRIGKSSLLIHFAQFVWVNYRNSRVAFVDMQDCSVQSEKGFLRRIAEQWLGENSFDGSSDDGLTSTAFKECVSRMEDNGIPMLLCIDEHDIIRSLVNSCFSERFLGNLRHCSQNGLSIVSAGVDPLGTIDGATRQSTEVPDSEFETYPLSPFQNTFTCIQLGAFTENEATEFVNETFSTQASSDGKSKEVVKTCSSGIVTDSENHPFKLQVNCYWMFKHLYDGYAIEDAKRRGKQEIDMCIPQTGLSE